MNHTSGLESTRADFGRTSSILAHVAASKLVAEPGRVFAYNNNAVDLLAVVVHRVTGMYLDDYLQENIFGPLRIAPAFWIKDAVGEPRAAGELHLRPRDLARIGEMMLAGGVWNHTRVLSADSIDELVGPSQPLNPTCGLLWWRLANFRHEITSEVVAGWATAGMPRSAVVEAQALIGRSYPDMTVYRDDVRSTLSAAAHRALAKLLGARPDLPYVKISQDGPLQAFVARGWLGQSLVVVPSAKLVAVRMRKWRETDRDGAAQVDDYPTFEQEVLSLAASTSASPPRATGHGQRPAPLSTRSQADRAYQAKDYPACGKLFLEAASASPSGRGSDDLYNAACCHALAGDREGAFKALEQAFAVGWTDIDHLKSDPDLVALHAEARWKSLVAAAEAKAKGNAANTNQELAKLYQEDQGDRHGDASKIDWATVGRRDVARRKRVREIMKAGGIKSAEDYFHAAMVFQHGDELDDYEAAHELAAKAAELDPAHDTARWLAAAAKDRLLMNSGKPQLYGTQFVQRDGVWKLHEVDPTITDEERARWNVPPLAEAKRRAEEMNRK